MGLFCVIEDDVLLYMLYWWKGGEDVCCIKKKILKKIVILFKIEENESVWDIYSFFINGYIFVFIVMYNDIWDGIYLYKIIRYNKYGVMI